MTAPLTTRLRLAFVLALTPVAAGAAHAGVGIPATSAPDHKIDDFLYAIRVVESGDHYDCPPGRYGEQGPYQFRRSVWRQYTTAPFSRATTAYADDVALLHYRWIVSNLQKMGLRPSMWTVAAAWNGGIGSVSRGRIPAASRNYATRVVNVIQQQAQIRAAMTPRFQIAYAEPR